MSSKTASKKYEKRGSSNPVKNPGPPDRKAAARLEVRLKDYGIMMNKRNSEASKRETRKEGGGFHRPGSMQKR